jgi:hypothetical protein
MEWSSHFEREELQGTRVKYFDNMDMSQSRPEDSYDGLHYLRGVESWSGHVASSFVQRWLNELFGECS